MATPVNQTPIFQSPFNKQRRDKFILVLTIATILKDKVAEIEDLKQQGWYFPGDPSKGINNPWRLS